MYHPTDRITHTTAFVTPVVGTGWNKKFREQDHIHVYNQPLLTSLETKHKLRFSNMCVIYDMNIYQGTAFFSFDVAPW